MKIMFRTTNAKKQEIAKNIVSFMNDTDELSKDSVAFIGNWILTDPDENTKAYYDIWNLILDQYLPEERPVLFRSCLRVSSRPIQSFTGRITAASRFSDGHKGHVLVCDTKEYMQYLEFPHDNYIRNFFPLSALVDKDMQGPHPHFSTNLHEEFGCEDEYIVRVDLCYLYDLKWSR